MKNQKAYTLCEMLISLVMTSILVLSMWSISSIGTNSQKRVAAEAQVLNDIHYGFKFLQNRVREASALYPEAATGSWVSQKLIVDHHAFGLFQNDDTTDFVYLPDKDDETNREVIFSVPSTGNVTLNFYKPPESAGSVWPAAQDGDELNVVRAELVGEKQRIPFEMLTTIMRRI